MSEAWKRASGWHEEGDGDDGLPTFGKKARRWFVRLLRARLGRTVNESELPAVLAWFAANPMPFVRWRDEEEYRSRNYSNGAWMINWPAVTDGCGEALREVRTAAEEARFPTLEQWLQADIQGDLRDRGDPGGADNLPKKQRRELKEMARARRKRLPHMCQSCSEEFTPTSNRAKRCTKCMNREPTGKRPRGALG
jgi:hypothetical protein